MNKAIFFDRDGVLNELVERDNDFHSPREFAEFHIKPDARDAVKLAKNSGYLCIVVSNQPDISRGLMPRSELDKMTEIMIKKLELDDVIYCLHDDYNDTGCRKPATGMFFKAKNSWKLDLNSSLMVGDTWKDVEAARRAGVEMVLLNAGYNLDLKVKNRIDSLVEIHNYIRTAK